MGNSYAQAVLRAPDLTEALHVAGQLLDLAGTSELEVDFEARVSGGQTLEKLMELLPDADWWAEGADRKGSLENRDSPSEHLPIYLSRWCMPPDTVGPFLAAAGDSPAMVRWDLSGWPPAPEIGLGPGGPRGAYVTICANARDLYLNEPSADHTVYVHVKWIEAERAPWLAAQVGLQVIGELQLAPV